MPVTFRTASHGANPVKSVERITSGQLLQSSCPSQRRICDEVLQSFLGSGENAAGNDLVKSTDGLVSTVISAYNQHHALLLRPDDIWLAILTQFNFYVNAHAEELRDKFVAHEGKQEVVVQAAGTRYSVDFGSLARQMTGQMEKFIVNPTLREWILPNFSTTTTNDTVVAAVVMMSTLKEYFSYRMNLYCGIPRVTLEGDKADWEEILRRAAKLKEYGPQTKAWYALLEPVLTRFVRAFDDPEANANLEFWQTVAHWDRGGSGPPYLSGWITAFCVFGSNGKWMVSRLDDAGVPIPVSDTVKEAWKRMTGKQQLVLDGVTYHRVAGDAIPPGNVSVDVLLDDNGEEINTMMTAGLVATRVSDSGDTTLSVSGKQDVVAPVPGWWMFIKKETE
ncbi:hypothetical protein BC835DRAFT_113538 [Cytidiella melzeri]|nr:hypothetical protein BC835DRAFT_113538 [Cytidiella melzeri]